MSEMTSIRVDFPPDELRALDQWSAAHGMAAREQAVRRLVQLGLTIAGGSDGEADLDAAAD
jgi:metal-responsive CopG/Arc/MetJ family transcriptional regulator